MCVSQRATRAVCTKIPTAAADDPLGLGTVIPIARPFPDVSVHIEEPPGVGTKTPDGNGAVASIESCVFRSKAVTGIECGNGSRPASVFPFGVGRQPVSTISSTACYSVSPGTLEHQTTSHSLPDIWDRTSGKSSGCFPSLASIAPASLPCGPSKSLSRSLLHAVVRRRDDPVPTADSPSRTLPLKAGRTASR